MPNRSSVPSRSPIVAAVIASSSLLALAACGSGDADHYALLATLEDSFGVPRLGGAMGVQPLSDYFPAK